MLEKQTVVDQIEILRDGHIQVRMADLIIEDGKEIAKTYYRNVLNPGDDLTGQNERVVAVANVVWTDEVLEEYQNKNEDEDQDEQ